MKSEKADRGWLSPEGGQAAESDLRQGQQCGENGFEGD